MIKEELLKVWKKKISLGDLFMLRQTLLFSFSIETKKRVCRESGKYSEMNLHLFTGLMILMILHQ
jgi:hypothetical protein